MMPAFDICKKCIHLIFLEKNTKKPEYKCVKNLKRYGNMYVIDKNFYYNAHSIVPELYIQLKFEIPLNCPFILEQTLIHQD